MECDSGKFSPGLGPYTVLSFSWRAKTEKHGDRVGRLFSAPPSFAESKLQTIAGQPHGRKS